ncbi:hypothetical protein PV645_37405, partial [Streptomyces scabiei]|nr:hypothetical protein [Streptomyces scabiei]
MRARDRRLTARLIAWGPDRLPRAGAGVEEAAEHTKLWWAAAVTMAAARGRRGRRAAAAGVAATAAAEVLPTGSVRAHHRGGRVLRSGRTGPAGRRCRLRGGRGARGGSAAAERGALPGRRGRG